MEFIKIDREQISLFGCSLDSLVEKNSKARLIARIVDGLDIKKLCNNYDEKDRGIYDPKIMLAT